MFIAISAPCFRSSVPLVLLLGLMLLMIGNGLQSTPLGVRGVLEVFSTLELSLVASAYLLGFPIGARIAPQMIRRVGHIRLFAALDDVDVRAGVSLCSS